MQKVIFQLFLHWRPGELLHCVVNTRGNVSRDTSSIWIVHLSYCAWCWDMQTSFRFSHALTLFLLLHSKVVLYSVMHHLMPWSDWLIWGCEAACGWGDWGLLPVPLHVGVLHGPGLRCTVFTTFSVEEVLPFLTTWISDLQLLYAFPQGIKLSNFLPYLKHKWTWAAIATQLKTQKRATYRNSHFKNPRKKTLEYQTHWLISGTRLAKLQ